MKDRIYNGNPMTVISTVIGILIILGACYAFFVGKIDWTQLLGALSIGAVMGGLKFDKGVPPSAPVLILGLGLLLSSCVTYDKCKQKYGSADTIRVPVTITKEVPVPIVVQPDSLQISEWIDSLKQLAPGDTITVADPKTKIEIKYWKDKFNKVLFTKAKYKGDTIEKMVYITVHDTVKCPVSVFGDSHVRVNDPGEFIGLSWWKWLIIIIILVGIIKLIQVLKN